MDSIHEMLEIGRLSGCAIEISHFKSCGMKNWKKEIHRAIERIQQAREAGQDVTCDFYPYLGGSTALTTMVPPVFVKGDMKAALARMGEDLDLRCGKRGKTKICWENCGGSGKGRIPMLLLSIVQALRVDLVRNRRWICFLIFGFTPMALLV